VLESAMSEVLKFGTNTSSYASRTIKGTITTYGSGQQ
jgi:hypothetical protein